MRKRLYYLLLLLAIAGSASLYFTFNVVRPAQSSALAAAPPPPVAPVAAPGRIEPISEEIKVAAEISGKLARVIADEGDLVRAGQTLAVLENSDIIARVASAQARLSLKEAELRRIVNGAREQERREAWARVEAAQAVMENAQVEMARRRQLHHSGVIAREESDRAEREFQVARARYQETRERHALVDDKAREEDESRAQADVALARAELAETRARLDKTVIRAPINGVILRRHLKSGESAEMANPIFTVADISRLRVRADIDETDVGKLRVGQRAYVTADTYGDKKFWGRVVRIGQLLGRKNVRTDEPTERVDNKILETLIELEGEEKLPPGLRVDTYIIVKD